MSTRTLRNNQYYNFSEIQTKLYEKSKEGRNFKNLLEIIMSEENILLAYRNIKANSGSKTAGIDKKTIKYIADMPQAKLVEYIKAMVSNYQPDPVRRVWIDKPDSNKKRPLGIPTIKDRIIQQMFLQVLEPICEAKFQKPSYGFRPNRATKHAVAKVQSFINIYHLYYSVDIDIKGFFDNVNHSRLMKQLWNMGIRDKRVLAIIGKILKAPIKTEGIPTKGVPQGGILSPLLSNIVLNDLDKWVMDQWETFETEHKYVGNHVKIANLRRTSTMKEGYIVRYADDFRIMARSYEASVKWFNAVKEFLNKRLNLEISEEKSQIVDVRRKSTKFLGFKIKAIKKQNKFVAKTNVSDERLLEMKMKLKRLIKEIKYKPSPENIARFNSSLIGMQQSFKYATHVNRDFNKLETKLWGYIRRSLHDRATYRLPTIKDGNSVYTKLYGSNTRKTWNFKCGAYMYPINRVKTVNNMLYSDKGNPYKPIKTYSWDNTIIELMRNVSPSETVEYMDNKLSRFSMQKGKCFITKRDLASHEVHCHHVTPRINGGTDKFDNLRIVHIWVHKLIHSTKLETINKYLMLLNLTGKQIVELNKLRAKCKLENIKY